MRWWHVAVVIVVGLAACGRVGFDSAQQLQPPHGGGETGSICSNNSCGCDFETQTCP